MTECEHELSTIDGMLTCIQCGFVKGMDLDPCIQTFQQHGEYTPSKKHYHRRDRFKRLFHNLQGLQEIPIPVMEQIPKNISIPKLRKYLKKNNMRNYGSKIASIWRQLGHEMKPISPCEIIRACHFFDEIKEKKSFLIVLPFICQKMNRSDLLMFLKPVSEAIKKKYQLLL